MIDLIGQALYGANYKPQLARALGISLRSVRRWANNGEPVPGDKWQAMIELLLAREHLCADLVSAVYRRRAQPIIGMYSVEGVKEIRRQCEAQQSYCEFPKCDGCGFHL